MDDSKASPANMQATASNTSSNGNVSLPPAATVRYRFPQRQSSPHDPSPSPRRPPTSPLSRRRSSLLSYSSLEDIRQAFTDDIVDPRTSGARKQTNENEVTHWHSTPLAFAFLPALGGLLFKDGKAFTSDILLLGLAAIFLNWSIRLPWDWYYSAQALRRDIEAISNDVVEEAAIETASSIGDSPILSPLRNQASEIKEQEQEQEQTQDEDRREGAAAELRRQEMLALVATFLFPMIAAYLLHVIRSQLSDSSNGLVSDYNLSIFLLAAEIRPCRQVVRLVSNRTLYLQRIVAGNDDPLALDVEGKGAITSLSQRIAELETKLGDATIASSPAVTAQKSDMNDLAVEIRKRYEPRLEGLERAVRRYEKRTTTLAITTEQRLQSLEHRIQEALSLAAVAAQHSQDQGQLSKLLGSTSALIIWPIKTAWNICMSPVLLLDELYARSKALLLGTTAIPPSNRRKHSVKQDAMKRDDKVRDRMSVRKVVK